MAQQQFKDNPLFIPVHECKAANVIFYAPAEGTEYHKSRELGMQVQDIFARCGISQTALQGLGDALIEKANNADLKTLRTDIGVLGNNLKYRLKNTVDSDCAVRMGAIGCFMEGEDPDNLQEAWTSKKLKLAAQHPDIHAFFLTLGVKLIPEYCNLLRGLQVEEYFQNRAAMIDALTLPSTQTT